MRIRRPVVIGWALLVVAGWAATLVLGEPTATAGPGPAPAPTGSSAEPGPQPEGPCSAPRATPSPAATNWPHMSPAAGAAATVQNVCVYAVVR